MWPPIADDQCNYSYQDNAALNPHDHYHHHHHHHNYPHSSAQHIECFQTLSCPSDLPVETSYYNVPPTYQDLGQTDLSPQFWCAEVDCAHERCASKDIPHEQSKILEEITKECDHILNNSEECDKCKVQHENGSHEAIPIDDLVDIVMQTVDNLKKNDSSNEETKMLSRKREQNKVAAARYRDKQKAKWQDLLDKKEVEEKRNKRLKRQVEELEKQVAEARQQFLSKISKK